MCLALTELVSTNVEVIKIFLMQQPVPVTLDVKLIATIGLGVAVACAVGLLLLLVQVGEDGASGYARMVSTVGLARQNLGWATLLVGLVTLGFVGMTTWLWSLYASFRNTSPLNRISRALEQQIEQGSMSPVPIRANDRLQSEWKEFEASVAALGAQHEELRQALGAVKEALAVETATAGGTSLARSVARLKEVEQRVRL